jgi:hypothetical protein
VLGERPLGASAATLRLTLVRNFERGFWGLTVERPGVGSRPLSEPDVTPNAESAFERFERLTRQLLSVPKKELEARIEQAKRESKRHRPRSY